MSNYPKKIIGYSWHGSGSFPSLGIKNRQISSKPRKAQGTEGQEARGKHLGHRALVPAPLTKNGIFLAEDVI